MDAPSTLKSTLIQFQLKLLIELHLTPHILLTVYLSKLSNDLFNTSHELYQSTYL